MLQKIKESVDYIGELSTSKPTIAVVIGSGLGALVKQFDIRVEIPYGQIPHFPESGVDGHAGMLLFGEYNGVHLAILNGRTHFYEGYSLEQIAFPVRVLHALGVKTLLLSNAVGGMNPEFSIGDIMMITDHINLIPNPLIGKHHTEFGPRFPDMSQAYDKELMQRARRIAGKLNISLKEGVYVGVTGPTYETPAEYKYYRLIGGDAIGMSTTCEVIVARQMSMQCFGLSVITDLGIPGRIEFLTHKMVQDIAAKAEPRLAAIFKELILFSLLD